MTKKRRRSNPRHGQQPKKPRTRRTIAKHILATDPLTLTRARLGRLKAFDIVTFNRNAERHFCHLLKQMLTLQSPLSIFTIIQELSYDLNISPETAKRYLYKHTASRADFALRDGQIVLRDPPRRSDK